MTAPKKKKPAAAKANNEPSKGTTAPAAFDITGLYLSRRVALVGFQGGIGTNGPVTREFDDALIAHGRKYKQNIGDLRDRYYSKDDYYAKKKADAETKRKAKLGLK